MRILLATTVVAAAGVCQAQYSASTAYQGCYVDGTLRALTGRRLAPDNQNSVQWCANACGLIGYRFSGVEYGKECYCGNSISNNVAKAADSDCNFGCPSSSTGSCGGFYRISIYKINNPQPSNGIAAFPIACNQPPMKGQAYCDASKNVADRVAALLANMTLQEKINNVVNTAYGALRLGLLPYESWNEALHGVGAPPYAVGGYFNAPGQEFGAATSFPMPITLGAAFDDELVKSVAAIIGKEARAFANAGRTGFNFWTPNINPFRDPRWGRGQETPGEDAFHLQSYVANLIPALEGSDASTKQILAACKHFAAYDIETGRYGNNYNPTAQDMAEYYLAPFKTCVRDAGVSHVMCSYNAVYGVPACASEYLLTDVLRSHYKFDKPHNLVVSDCDAVRWIYDSNGGHRFTSDGPSAAAVALNAGVDIECGNTYQANLKTAIDKGFTTEAKLNKALTRFYTSLFKIGYFDGQSTYNSLTSKDVDTQEARNLAYQTALEGTVLLKNDGTLPLTQNKNTKVAIIGPYAAATTQMQGIYYGIPPFLESPLAILQQYFSTTKYAQGTGISSTSTDGFAAALDAARSSDVVLFFGGIDNTVEAEGLDRTSIGWPGNQLQLIQQLTGTGKPVVVVQYGGGMVDSSALLQNTGVKALLWAGYPSQSAGSAIRDILIGVWSVAGRLPSTMYPSSYTDAISLYDMNLRPTGGSPGRTYKWYTGTPVLPFGHGLHYTNFSATWIARPSQSYSIASITGGSTSAYLDTAPFITVSVDIRNTGGRANMFSDYVGLLYISSDDSGPTPRPKKSLVAYTRAHNIQVGATSRLSFRLTLSSLARSDVNGALTIYPGTYRLFLDNDARVSATFSLTGNAKIIESVPKPRTDYKYSVPVNPATGSP